MRMPVHRPGTLSRPDLTVNIIAHSAQPEPEPGSRLAPVWLLLLSLLIQALLTILVHECEQADSHRPRPAESAQFDSTNDQMPSPWQPVVLPISIRRRSGKGVTS